jgi:hypothetical protein
MHFDDLLRVGKTENGFVVGVTDPKIREKNRVSGDDAPYEDPDKEFVFKTAKEVKTFVSKIIDGIEVTDADSDFADEFKLITKGKD